MELIEIQFGSERYQHALHLRNDILRRPLGLDLFAEDLDIEAGEWHFGVEDDDQLIATVTLRPDGPGRVRLRQMAVVPDLRGTGVGRLLIERVEPILRIRGIDEIYLHARAEAEGFYSRLGYQREGEEFVEVGIRHVEMGKKLAGAESEDMHPPQFKILYDGECPFCRLEVDWLKRRDRRGNLLTEDIAAPGFNAAQYGTTLETLMGSLHGVTPEGQMTDGMETFRRAYQAAGIGWLVAPTGWPLLRPLFDGLYWLFARYRVRLGRMFGRSCEGDKCAMPVNEKRRGT